MVSVKCIFFLGPENDARKYKFGGNPEGSLDLYDDRIEIFKKSKAVMYAFGAIGSAIEGKGKASNVIPTEMIINYSKDKSNKYMIYLRDGNVLYATLTGLSKSDSIKAMDDYLNYVINKQNKSSKINQNNNVSNNVSNTNNTKKVNVEKVDINNAVEKNSYDINKEKKNTTKKESNWECVECGTSNTGRFCLKCGHEKPKNEKTISVNKVVDDVNKEKKNTTKKEINWECVECGTSNTGRFCLKCGHEKPKNEKTVSVNKVVDDINKEKKNTTKKEKNVIANKTIDDVNKEKKNTTRKEKNWECIECGTSNTGKFCINCGHEKPKKEEIENNWVCDRCNTSNTGKFCSNCGHEKPKKEEIENNWVCDRCNTSNTGKFCSNCGHEKPKKEEIENNWVCDRCNTSNTGKFCINCGYEKPNKVETGEESWTCYRCGTYNSGKYCIRCGNKKLEDEYITENKFCKVCGQKVEKNNLYCIHCGSPII